MKFSLRSLILLVALCGSAYGLWARWGPWRISSVGAWDSELTIMRGRSNGRTKDGRLLKLTGWIERTGSAQNDYWCSRAVVRDIESGIELAVLPIPERSMIGRIWFEDTGSIVAKETGVFDDDEGVRQERARLFRLHRHRPEQWYGVAWLPEFWLTAILATALLWSLRRDMLNLKTAVEPNSDQPQSEDGRKAVG